MAALACHAEQLSEGDLAQLAYHARALVTGRKPKAKAGSLAEELDRVKAELEAAGERIEDLEGDAQDARYEARNDSERRG